MVSIEYGVYGPRMSGQATSQKLSRDSGPKSEEEEEKQDIQLLMFLHVMLCVWDAFISFSPKCNCHI